ncbi:MAG: hypothetical protein IH840_13005, partial [Candidatus Heimdallarchaeota archaeon]|nr:hypothetical protein [Candidatus Heimdallarchaeota archaeon]
GSHLPAEDNGIILVDGLGNYFKGLMPVSSTSMTSWDKLGKQYFFDTQVQDYKQFLANFITFQEYGGFHGKLLIDPVHGPMKDYLLYVLDNPATTIVELNFEEDDLFPGRISEPTPDNLKWTSLKVKDENCDLGIATDMDGDRIIFISKNGDAISGDYIGALFAKWIWQKDPSAKVVVPINTSAIINHVADELNGTMIYCKVGPPSIIESIRDNNAKFAFEETGKYIFPETAIWPDSAVSLIFLLSGLAKKNSTLEKELNLFPKLFAKKIKLPCLRSIAPEVMRIVESELLQSLEGIKKIETMDGLRINFTNLSWLLIRPSGTEDYVRIFSEHGDPDKNEELSNLGKSLVLEALKYLASTE